jgi:hypothetical protein
VRRIRLAAALLAASPLFHAGCGGLRGLRPGGTEHGLAVSVVASDPVMARRAAVESVLGLYLSPDKRAASRDALDELLARPAKFTGREKLKDGTALVEVKLAPLAAALEEAGLVRPSGFPTGPGRVLIVLSEPKAPLGAGYASDSLRRALTARGVSAADASDMLLKSPTLRAKTVDELVKEAFASGVDYVLLGGAAVEASVDESAGAWRAEAVLDARLKTSPADEGALVDAAAHAVDLSSGPALAKALEQAGDEAAAPASAAIAAARKGRAELLVEARGGGGPSRMSGLIASLRSLQGVKGAALLTHRTDEGAAIVRVFAENLKTDELAARLLRADPSLVVLGVEPENARLIVELGSPEGF